MSIVVLFTLAKLWSHLRCPITDEWKKKIIYIMEYNFVIKKSEIMSFAEKWMVLEITVCHEISQTQKVKSCIFSLICGT
jgi:hypothetical protein